MWASETHWKHEDTHGCPDAFPLAEPAEAHAFGIDARLGAQPGVGGVHVVGGSVWFGGSRVGGEASGI